MNDNDELVRRVNGCESKQRYVTQIKAYLAIRKMQKSHRDVAGKIYVYRCKFCFGYHLTRTPQIK